MTHQFSIDAFHRIEIPMQQNQKRTKYHLIKIIQTMHSSVNLRKAAAPHNRIPTAWGAVGIKGYSVFSWSSGNRGSMPGTGVSSSLASFARRAAVIFTCILAGSCF